MKVDYVAAAIWLAAMVAVIGHPSGYEWMACLAAAIAHLRLAVGAPKQ